MVYVLLGFLRSQTWNIATKTLMKNVRLKIDEDIGRTVVHQCIVVIISVFVVVLQLSITWRSSAASDIVVGIYTDGAGNAYTDGAGTEFTKGSDYTHASGTLSAALLWITAVLSVTFWLLLLKENRFMVKNRMGTNEVPWYAFDSYASVVFETIITAPLFGAPWLHPLFTLAVFFRVGYLFKLLRFMGSSVMNRRFQIQAHQVPAQDGITAFKVLLRKKPWVSLLMCMTVGIPTLSWCLLSLERWAFIEDGNPGNAPRFFGDTLYQITMMVTVGDTYETSQIYGLGKILSVIASIIGALLMTMMINALMQTIEADSNLEAQLEATALEQAKADVKTTAANLIFAWYNRHIHYVNLAKAHTK